MNIGAVDALLKKSDKEFPASLIKKGDKAIEKLEIKNKEEADKILQDLNECRLYC